MVTYIVDFPFDVFTRFEESIFLRMSLINAIRVSILSITKMTDDPEGYTLLNFKNEIVNNWIKDEYKREFINELRMVKFDEKTREAQQKVKLLRNEQIAHLNKSLVFDPSRNTTTFSLGIDDIDFREIVELRNAINLLFETLSFGISTVTLPLGYGPNRHEKTDIEQLLDEVVRNSSLFRMPEQYPARWMYARNQLDERKLWYLNYYRRKFGLPEV